MFNISADFNMADVEAYIQAETEAWFQELVEDYRAAGKTFVEKIRARAKPNSFGNITWNLRSSIGYLIVYNGQVIEAYFPTVGSGSEGSTEGENYAREVALLVNQGEGVQLVVVAGMEYAAFVESKGIDVITDASKNFPKDLLAEFKR